MLELIDPAEIMIVALSAAASVLAGHGLRSALCDRIATRKKGINGGISLWANAAIWDQAMRVGAASMLLVAGCISLTLPSAFEPNWLAWWVRSIEQLAVGFAGILLVAAIHAIESRRALRESQEPGWDGVERRKGEWANGSQR